MATTNPDLKNLLQMLLDQHAALLAQLDTVTDDKLADAILGEAQELLHRVNLTQNLLLVAVAQAVTDAVTAVKAADATLTQDLKTVADAASLIDKVTKFLGFVDKAIDLAKKVALI